MNSRQRVVRAIVGAVVGLGLVSGATQGTPAPITKAPASNPFRTGKTLNIAHAGGDALFPEGTLLAYDRSTVLGSDVIDVDVQLAGDGTLVSLHDATVDRTTNGTGLAREMTYPQLRNLDAGYRFAQKGKFPFRGKGITIPTVQEIVSRFPASLVTLDLKDQRLKVVQPVCELISNANRVDTIYVGVDTDEQVNEFRRLCPTVHTSGTSAERKALRAARETGNTRFVTKQWVSQPPFIGDDGAKRVTASTLAFSHQLNIAVLTWVVDDPKDMAELVELGVDGIYTRRPDLLEKVIQRQATKQANKRTDKRTDKPNSR
jgi:glycerophosphoryl diester phosphodiesterase